MKFRTKAALKLAKIAKISLASQTLDDVTIYFLDGDELIEGIEVFDIDDNGEYVTFPDGSYKWGDKTVVISDSIVKSIITNESEENLEVGEEVKEEINEEVKDLEEIVSDLIEVVEGLGGSITEIREEMKLVKQENENTKKELNLAKQTSNRDFEEPGVKKTNDKISFDPVEELKKFGIS